MSRRKIGRNDPCSCGSGKKHKRCCLGLSEQEIEKRRIANLPQPRNEQAERVNPTFVQECVAQLARRSSYDLLLDLGSLALLPENQGSEPRFLHLAEIICSQPISAVEGQPDFAAARSMCEAFDARYGDQWESYEVDNQYVPYLSWVPFEQEVFRVFSGTLTQSELYVADVFKRFLPLDPLVSEVLGFSVTDFFAFFLPRIDGIIQDVGLTKFESRSPEDFPSNITCQELGLAQRIREALEAHLVFDQASLSGVERQIVEAFSKDLGSYKPDMGRLLSEDADIMQNPIVKVGGKYIIPFPELLLSVIPLRASRALAVGPVRDRAAAAFESNTRGWLKSILERAFGTKAVLESPTVDGRRWCDFAVLFDGKVMQFIFVPSPFGEDVDKEVRGGLDVAYGGWDALNRVPSPCIESGSRKFRFTNTDLVEPMLFVVFETLSNMFMAGIPRGVARQENVFLLIDTGALEYLLGDTGSPMRFLKFLRADQRIRERAKEVFTTSPLDMYALFKGAETIQVRGAKGRVDFMVVAPTSFPSVLLDQIREYRSKHGIFEVEGSRRVLRQYYPGVHGDVDEHGNVLLLLPYQPQEVTIEAQRPEIGRQELGTLYLAFDSLCYQLSIQREWISSLLDARLEDIRAIKVQFRYAGHEGPVKWEEARHGDTLTVVFTVSSALAEVFQRRNNDGERLMLGEFLRSVGLSDEARDLLEKALAPSEERGFQQVLIPVQHESFELDAKPIPIFRSDEAWVDEVIARAMEASTVKPGVYEDRKATLQLVVDMFNIANREFEQRLQLFAANELLGRCYEQLEIAYIDLERTKFQLAIAGETDKFGGVVEEYARAEREATKLTFAIRHLLETTIKLQPKGSGLLTAEAYTELLALSARTVNMDFLGDGIYLSVQPGKFEVTEAGFVSWKTREGESYQIEQARSELRTYQRRVENLLGPEVSLQDGLVERAIAHFDPAFQDEFGYSLNDRLELHEELLGRFRDTPNPLQIVEEAVLNRELCEATGKDQVTVNRFLADLELSEGHLRDVEIHPSERYWRDARIMSRPLVRISAPGGERLLFSRTVLERAYMVFLQRLISGRLKRHEEMRSDSFRSAVGEWRNKLGDEFRDEVAKVFSEHAWRIDTEVKSLGNIGVPAEVGPIDIIAIDEGEGVVKVVECKDVSLSRNPKDIKNEIDNFFGRGAEPGYFARLERKWKWVSDNVVALVKKYGLDASRPWSIAPLMVTSTFLISRQFRAVPTHLETFGDLGRDWRLATGDMTPRG